MCYNTEKKRATKKLSGIRQGDPLSPALFSALLGHILAPLIAEWKRKGWGVELNQDEPLIKITILAYADDVTILAANEAQACAMIKEIADALAGINLQLLPQKCSALSSTRPNGSSTSKIKLGDIRIPIAAELTILGQEVAFRGDSMHSLKHRTRQAWKTAQMNTNLLRSTKTSHTKRLRLLQALVKPSVLYGCETWKLTPGTIAKIISTERTFTRWCLRKTNRHSTPEIQEEEDEGTMAWIQWRVTSAREIAKSMSKGKIERWHVTALRMHWQWAGHAARRIGTYNHSAATAHIKPAGRGRPPPQWSQLLRTFSTQELRGPPNQWEILAQNRADWNTFADIFIQFVETHILRSDTRATLARDMIASRTEED